jgi:CO/xanthine dehydrogenase FAD-binding subunit
MRPYLSPTSVEEALHLLASHHGQAQIIAGGTDILPDIRQGKKDPHCLVDITRILALKQIEIKEEFVEIGAAVTFAAIKDAPFLNQHVHALVEAACSVGAIGIQTAATWVGNVVQAMPAADGAIVALALEAEARVVDVRGAEWRPVEALFRGPGVSAVDPTRQLVTHMRFPRPSGAWGSAWRRVGRRPSLVLPILNCAVKLSLDPDGARIERATVALGPVAPRPFRARKAEAFLRGRAPAEDVFVKAARIVQDEANPRSSLARASREYRLANIPALVSEALFTAAERARNTITSRA